MYNKVTLTMSANVRSRKEIDIHIELFNHENTDYFLLNYGFMGAQNLEIKGPSSVFCFLSTSQYFPGTFKLPANGHVAIDFSASHCDFTKTFPDSKPVLPGIYTIHFKGDSFLYANEHQDNFDTYIKLSGEAAIELS